MRGFVREKGKGVIAGVMGNMLRRGENRWLCTKIEFAFAGHGILIRVLPPSFLALTVNELCLLFWPNPYATSFVVHIFRMRFSHGIFMLFGGRCEISL